MEGLTPLHLTSDTLLYLSLIGLLFFIRKMISSNSHKFSQAFEKIESLNKQITDLQKERWTDVMILAVVNGKYISRRESELMAAQGIERRALMIQRLDTSDDLIERLRKFKDHDYNEAQTSLFLRIAFVEKGLAVLEAVSNIKNDLKLLAKSQITP